MMKNIRKTACSITIALQKNGDTKKLSAMVVPLKFNTLSKADQADLLQLEGIYLSSRWETEFIIDRYQLDTFYVDVYYQASTGDAVLIQSFYPKQQQPPIYQMHLPRLFIRQGA